MNCPVCGKGKYQLLDGIDGPIENPTQPVSHLACVEHIAEDFDKLQREKKHAEAELAALKCCGNCERYQWPAYGQPLLCGANEPGLDDLEVEPHDSCRWTPARWTARAEEGGGT